MNTDVLAGRIFEGEFVFNATRSSGPGGQNVNKVSTRIELRFDIMNSALLNENEKLLLLNRLKSKISKEGILIIVTQTERSQFENKERSVQKFYTLITKALTPVKKRRKTLPTAASRVKRKEGKVKQSMKKARRKPSFDE
jgi:ribosome-associated protein